MRLRKKKTLMDQAADFVDSLKPTIESAVDTAKDTTRDLVESALESAKDARDTVVEKAGPALSDARDTVVDKTGPALTEARVRGSAALSDARDSAAPLLAQGRAAAAEKASVGAALVAEKAAESREYAATKVAELKGEQPKKRSKLATILILTGLAGLAAFVYKKATASDDSWQSAYSPTPAPSQDAPTGTDAVANGAAVGGGGLTAAALDEIDEGEDSPVGDDEAAASPDEALADSATAPHPVTTPEEPVESVDVADESAAGETDKA